MNPQSLYILLKLLEQAKNEREAETESEQESEDEEPCDCNLCSPSQEPETPVIESLIANMLDSHLKAGTFPSLEEAQTAHILNSILRGR